MEELNTHSDLIAHLLKPRKHEVGCEVGVHTGDTTITLLEKLPDIRIYHAVDPWESYETYDGSKYRKPGNKKFKTWSSALEYFIKRTKKYKKKIRVHRMTSVEAVKSFDDESLDWVFIDANHEYPYIKENLELWAPKVKVGGFVSGHDYGNKWNGIKKAVDEFVPKNKLHIGPRYVWWYNK
jgi:hypothetical protein